MNRTNFITAVLVAIAFTGVCSLTPPAAISGGDPVKCAKWTDRNKDMAIKLADAAREMDAAQGALALDFDNEKKKAKFIKKIKAHMALEERKKKITAKMLEYCQ